MRVELADDQALGQPIDAAEAEPLRQFLQRFADGALVARIQRRQPIAQHDPICVEPPLPSAFGPRLFHDSGVAADTGEVA